MSCSHCGSAMQDEISSHKPTRTFNKWGEVVHSFAYTHDGNRYRQLLNSPAHTLSHTRRTSLHTSCGFAESHLYKRRSASIPPHASSCYSLGAYCFQIDNQIIKGMLATISARRSQWENFETRSINSGSQVKMALADTLALTGHVVISAAAAVGHLSGGSNSRQVSRITKFR